jgi:hypothetical protein
MKTKIIEAILVIILVILFLFGWRYCAKNISKFSPGFRPSYISGVK